MILRLFAFFALCGATAFAQLKWEQDTIVCDALTSDKEIVRVFHFTNTGKTPVTISKVASSCDCVSAALTKREYAPGEKGEIKVTFTVEGREGVQKKGIEVTSDDAAQQKMTLALAVNIQQPVKMTPTVLWWKIGVETKTQTIHVTASELQPTVFNGVECTDPKWKVELKTLKAGHEYTVEITPATTEKAASAIITLKTDGSTGNERPFTARLRVQ